MDYDNSRMDNLSVDKMSKGMANTVQVNNAGISYRSFNGRRQLVFQHVDLAIPQGIMYALLGPSGCGKTSLIRCILGRLDLDEGSVSVFGHRPGTAASGVPGPLVGYMPQETSIPEQLTIGQCWTYYGTILGLSKKKINDAITYFIELLNLPPADTVIIQLSGGESRRVAFATALIHEPKLLILDEPTVGIDCITKKKMWDHLLKLANEKNASMILTTHYIEEAKSAHKVGMMHGNTLAVEDYTENLLRRFSCDSLEDVFFKVCSNLSQRSNFDTDVEVESTDVWIPMENTKTRRVQALTQDDLNDSVLEDNNKQKIKRGSKSLSLRDFHVRSFVLKAVILKNWLHLFRLKGFSLVCMLFPCIIVSIAIFTFGEILGQVQVALVNNDKGALGNQYLTHLSEDVIHLHPYNSDFSALGALHGGHLSGCIVIGQNFSDAHLDRIINFPLVNPTILNDSVIRVTLDDLNEQMKFIRLHLINAYEQFLYETYNETGLNYLLAHPVISVERRDVEYILIPRNLIPILTVISIGSFFGPFPVAILSIFVDLNFGHLERSIVTGVSLAEIILGLLVILIGHSVVQLVFVFAVAFSFTLHALSWGSFLLLFFVLFVHQLCGMSMGILLSLSTRHLYVLIIMIGNMCILSCAISGGLWPLISVPYFARGIFLALPVANQVRAVAAIYLGTGNYLFKMLCSLASSLAYTFGFILLSFILLRIRT